MKNKRLILVSISFIILFSVIIIFISNKQPNTIHFNGNIYTNQNSIVPIKFIGDKIGSKSGYSYYEIRNSNKDYHIAVEKEETDYFYFYKTKDANGINFAE